MPPYSTFHTIVFILFVISLQSYSSESLLHSSGRLWHPQLNPRPVGTVSLLSSLLAQGKVNTSDDEESSAGGKKSLWKRVVHGKKTSSVQFLSSITTSTSSTDQDADSSQSDVNTENAEPGPATCSSVNNTVIGSILELDVNQALLPEDPEEEEETQAIAVSEMQAALQTASKLLSSPIESIVASGWKLVHHREHGDVSVNATRCFSLYKRRKAASDGGSVEYLMTGEFSDISPVSFLSVQLDQQHRKQWDSTMKDMSVGEILLAKLWNNKAVTEHPITPVAAAPITTSPETASHTVKDKEDDNFPTCNPHTAALRVIKDVLYYRTKWPWPMKDRDYVLARRCKIFDANNSMVLVSKSIESPLYPAVEGVIRVDNYVCHTTVLSTASLPVTMSGPRSPSNSEMALPASGDVDSQSTSPLEMNTEKMPKHHPTTAVAAELESHEPAALHKSKQPKFRIQSKMLHAAVSRWKNTLTSPIAVDAERMEPIDIVPETVEQKVKQRVVRSNTLYKPGMKFVTIFCDDNKVPLHPRIVDMLSKQGEKVVPDSMLALHAFAKQLELQSHMNEKLDE